MTVDDVDLSHRSASELLSLHSRVLSELVDRGVVSSRSFPLADYAKLVVAEGLGGELTPAPSTPGDVTTPDGRSVQVRSRVHAGGSAAVPAFAAVRSSAADAFVFVVLENDSLEVEEALEVPVAQVASSRPTLEDLRSLPGATDVTRLVLDAQRRVDFYGRTASIAGRPVLPTPRNPWSAPEPVHLPAVPTAVVQRTGVTLAGIREAFDEGFALLGASEVSPAGPAFAVYRGDPADVFDLEIGYPVDAPLAGEDGEVRSSTLPAGAAIALSHVGGYDGLGPAWGRLTAAVAEGGHAPGGQLVEVYVTQPTPDADPATMRTDLFALLAEPA